MFNLETYSPPSLLKSWKTFLGLQISARLTRLYWSTTKFFQTSSDSLQVKPSYLVSIQQCLLWPAGIDILSLKMKPLDGWYIYLPRTLPLCNHRLRVYHSLATTYPFNMTVVSYFQGSWRTNRAVLFYSLFWPVPAVASCMAVIYDWSE
jgi:hypothetical protein